jgi:hypothetical protein
MAALAQHMAQGQPVNCRLHNIQDNHIRGAAFLALALKRFDGSQPCAPCLGPIRAIAFDTQTPQHEISNLCVILDQQDVYCSARLCLCLWLCDG